MVIDYYFGERIPKAQRQDVVDIHRSNWSDYAFRNVEDLDTKIGLYGDGISCLSVDDVPVGVGESWLILTEGRNEDIPKTEKALRECADRSGNTRVLVTCTIKGTERSKRIGGPRLVDIYLTHLFKYYEPSDFCITFSPDTPPAQKLHDRHNACYMGDDFLLVDARPGLVLEGVPAANVRPRGYKWIKNGSVYAVSGELTPSSRGEPFNSYVPCTISGQ